MIDSRADFSTIPPKERAALLLENIRSRDDEYGDVANSCADLLRDALVLAARELNDAEAEVERLQVEVDRRDYALYSAAVDLSDSEEGWRALMDEALRG